MCLGLPALIGGGLQIISGAAQYQSQAAYAKAKQSLDDQISKRNRAMALEASQENYGALQQRDIQLHAKAAEQILEVSREARAARGRVSTAAAEANVTGTSVDELLNTFEQSQLEYINKINTNRVWQQAQAESDMRAIRMGLESKLVASTPDVVARPNLWANALGSFASAFNSAVSIQSAIDPTAFRSTLPNNVGYQPGAWDQFGNPISLDQ